MYNVQANFTHLLIFHLLVHMVADLCHVVLSCFRGEKAKMRHAKTRQMVTFSCFRMATFRSATRMCDTFHASHFRLLFVVSLPGGAKGRHAKNPLKSPFGGFSHGDLSRSYKYCFSACQWGIFPVWEIREFPILLSRTGKKCQNIFLSGNKMINFYMPQKDPPLVTIHGVPSKNYY